MASNDNHIDVLLNQLTAPNTGINALSNILKNVIRETRETVLSSFLSNGQDPLLLLDVRSNTLAVLYILWVVFHFVFVWLIITPSLDLPELAEVFLILNLHLGLLFKTFVGGLTLNMPVTHLIVVCSLPSFISIVRLITTFTVTKLAKGIHRLASHYGSVSIPFFFFPLPFSFIQQTNLAIHPLHDLLTRYPHDTTFLTTIHPIFMLVRSFLTVPYNL